MCPGSICPKGKPRLLLFEKINGFKDTPSVNAARAAILAMAERKGWAVAITDKGGVFNPRSLRAFDAVIWNNISGDVLTLSQRRAFQRYLARRRGLRRHARLGGRSGLFLGLVCRWPARRAVHGPSDESAIPGSTDRGRSQRIRLPHALPQEWRMTDEWYSFRTNPRAAGAKVLLTLDESTYKQPEPMGMNLQHGR